MCFFDMAVIVATTLPPAMPLITLSMRRSHIVQQVHSDMGAVPISGGADDVAHALLLHAGLCDNQAGLCAAHQHERRDVSEVSGGVRWGASDCGVSRADEGQHIVCAPAAP